MNKYNEQLQIRVDKEAAQLKYHKFIKDSLSFFNSVGETECWEPSLEALRTNSNWYINWAMIKCADKPGIGAMYAVILHVCCVTCAGTLYNAKMMQLVTQKKLYCFMSIRKCI